MYLEEEVYSLLVLGFSAVVVVSAILLTAFYLRSHNKHIFWFGGQLVFLSLAFYCFYQCIARLPSHGDSMYSENQSLTLALSGLCWAISMALNLIGVHKILRGPNHPSK